MLLYQSNAVEVSERNDASEMLKGAGGSQGGPGRWMGSSPWDAAAHVEREF